MLRFAAPSLLAIALHATAAAQESTAPPFDLGPRTWVVTDAPGDGTVWARGSAYKARFGADAAELIPAFGTRASENRALLLAAPQLFVGGLRVELDERATPVLGAPVPATGPTQRQRVAYERGALVERWDLEAAGIEHSFVLERPLGRGAILLRVPLRGELAFAGRNAAPGAGLRFEARAADGALLGGLDYSDAITLDRRGARLEHASTLVADPDGSAWLELRVPAEFADAACYPLVIDPLVTIFGVDQGSNVDAQHPDVAYDATNNAWLVAWHEPTSFADNDVFARRFALDGTLLEEVGVAIDNQNAQYPSVANNNAANQFLIAWFRNGAVFDENLARTRNAGSTAQGATFPVASDFTLGSPVVGGDPSPSGSGYLLAYRNNGIQQNQLVVMPISTAGVLGAPVSLDGSLAGGGVFGYAITKSAGPHGRYGVAWTHHNCPPSSVCPPILRAAVFFASGQLIGNAINTGFPNDSDVPAIAGDGETFVLLAERQIGAGNRDIAGALVRVVADAPQIVATTSSLTAVETPSTVARDQLGVRLTAQGNRFTYSYLEETSAGSGVHAVHVATMLVTNSLQNAKFVESHVLMHANGVDHRDLALASTSDGGDGLGRVCGAWTRDDFSDKDVDAYLYDPLKSGGVAFAQTGCGGAFPFGSEPILATSPQAALGAEFGVQVGGSGGTALILVGSVATVPIPLCAAGCALGVFPIVNQLAVAATTFVLPTDVALLGKSVAVQGVRLVPTGTGGQCGAPDWPISFRTTDTAIATFQ